MDMYKSSYGCVQVNLWMRQSICGLSVYMSVYGCVHVLPWMCSISGCHVYKSVHGCVKVNLWKSTSNMWMCISQSVDVYGSICG